MSTEKSTDNPWLVGYTARSEVESEMFSTISRRSHLWRSLFLVSATMFLSTSLNALGGIARDPHQDFTFALLSNSIASVLSLLSVLGFGFAWIRNRRQHRLFLESVDGSASNDLDVSQLGHEIDALYERLRQLNMRVVDQPDLENEILACKARLQKLHTKEASEMRAFFERTTPLNPKRGWDALQAASRILGDEDPSTRYKTATESS